MAEGTYAIITGVRGGIGQALAQVFARDHQVIGIDMHDEAPPFCAHYFACDLADGERIGDVGAQIAALTPKVACLVHNAAYQVVKPLVETAPQEWSQTFAVNVEAAFHLVRALHTQLAGGSIVFMASVHARATSPGLAAYAASKGALVALARALALELAPQHTRVNAVLPGAVDTAMLRASLARGEDAESQKEQLIHATPLRRIAHANEIAELAHFLTTAAAANITGQSFVSDGGVLARLASE